MARKKMAPNPHGVDLRSRLPQRLSPSRAKDYMQCPRLFYYKTILGLRTPNTQHTAKGSIAHEAYERIFDHPRGERTPQLAVSYVRPAWEEMRTKSGYRELVAKGLDFEENEIVRPAEEAVRNWFRQEDPNRFDPIGIEIRVGAPIAGVYLHGYIDRFDRNVGPDGAVYFVVADYKTGKTPKPQYEDEAFFQLEVYALLLKEMMGIDVWALRLIYTMTGEPDAVLMRRVTPQMLERTRKKIAAVWKAIVADARRGEFATRTGPLCNWCHFQTSCPAFNPELPLGDEVAEAEDALAAELDGTPVTIGNEPAA